MLMNLISWDILCNALLLTLKLSRSFFKQCDLVHRRDPLGVRWMGEKGLM